MASYVAVKHGDEYLLEPKVSAADARPLVIAAGGVTALYGLLHGRFFGLLLFTIGIGAIVRSGSTAHGAGKQPRSTRGARSPSHQHDWRKSSQRPADEVEEASMESFPASDPPTFTRTKM